MEQKEAEATPPSLTPSPMAASTSEATTAAGAASDSLKPPIAVASTAKSSSASDIAKNGAIANGSAGSSSGVRYNRIFKKTSQDGNLVLFLPHRELMITENKVEPLIGVALVHESALKQQQQQQQQQLSKAVKVFIQVVLLFRYGREDEELMGLRFCNEIVIAAEQLYPTASAAAANSNSGSGSNSVANGSARNKDGKREGGEKKAEEGEKEGEAKEGDEKDGKKSILKSVAEVKRPKPNGDGFLTFPFALDMGSSAPPSVRLLPCRPYNGAPIGTTYEVQLFIGNTPEDLPKKRKMVQMAVRLYERLPRDLPPRPAVTLDKQYMFSDKNLVVQARLDSGVYSESDVVHVSLLVRRPGGHGARKMRVCAVQQVGVAMFSTGNFKNLVGFGKVGGGESNGNAAAATASSSNNNGESSSETKQRKSGVEWHELDPTESCYRASIAVKLELGGRGDYSWVAMDETAKRDADIRHLAPTVVHANKAMFIIRVHYYVHVRLWFGVMRRGLSLKLPFLMRRSRAAEEQLAEAVSDKTSKAAK